MVKLYDIISDDDFHPSLIEVSSIKLDRDILNNNIGIELLFKELHLNQFDNERVFLVSLDMYNRILGLYLIGLGDYKGSKIYNRHITTALILSGARSFIIIHNHPDGALSFSDDDKTMEIIMTTLSKILEIEFKDSYVVTKAGYISTQLNKPIKFKRR